jgi:hypothetical protein
MFVFVLFTTVDNKNNAKDPTRFHFSLRLSNNPPSKKNKSEKKLFFDHPPILFIFFIISQCSRQETNTLSPEGLPMSNIAVYC